MSSGKVQDGLRDSATSGSRRGLADWDGKAIFHVPVRSAAFRYKYVRATTSYPTTQVSHNLLQQGRRVCVHSSKKATVRCSSLTASAPAPGHGMFKSWNMVRMGDFAPVNVLSRKGECRGAPAWKMHAYIITVCSAAPRQAHDHPRTQSNLDLSAQPAESKPAVAAPRPHRDTSHHGRLEFSWNKAAAFGLLSVGLACLCLRLFPPTSASSPTTRPRHQHHRISCTPDSRCLVADCHRQAGCKNDDQQQRREHCSRLCRC